MRSSERTFRLRMRQDTASTLRSWWAGHSGTLLRLGVVLMALAASIWLGYEFWRLLWGEAPIWGSSPIGAYDLKLRHEEVHLWFAGRPVYTKPRPSTYPPGSYVILWPLLGWLNFAMARRLWAATSGVALGWLIYLIVRESRADTSLERAFVAFIPLSMYATGATIGNGQLMVHLLPMLVAGLLLLQRRQCGCREDLVAAALLLIALVKPSVSVPFFWIVLLVPGRLRPALLVTLGYVVLTLLAASFQEAGLLPLFRSWLARSSGMAEYGYADLHLWLRALGLKEWILPASLLTLVALGFWTYRYRHGDLWLVLGVTAVVGRLWTYHRWHDDLLMLLPMVALFRVAKRGARTDGGDVMAGVLLAIITLAMLAPGGLYLLPPPLKMLYVFGLVLVWVVVLVFLLDIARRQDKAMARR
jgi:hypothetical protein